MTVILDRLYPNFQRSLLFVAFLMLALVNVSVAQSNKTDSIHVVQISGKVVAVENDEIVEIPYAVVAVQGTHRGTLTDIDGFFSIVVRTGETLAFSVLGFKDAFYHIPNTLTSDRVTWIQKMTSDTIQLAEAIIYPWPDPDHFNQEFLAMDVHDDLEDIAAENLSEKAMTQLREYLPADGQENTSYYLRQQSQDYYYEGQIRTSKLLDAFAWKEFIQAWKRGDFKKKE